jgi:hypothetical protein
MFSFGMNLKNIYVGKMRNNEMQVKYFALNTFHLNLNIFPQTEKCYLKKNYHKTRKTVKSL